MATELRDDRDIVQAAISQGGGGLELQYASTRLRADPDMVRQACASDGCALAYCPVGPTLEELTHDRDFMTNVVLAQENSGGMWKLASPLLKDDPDLLMLALKNGLSISDIPMKFKTDLPFLQRCLQVVHTFQRSPEQPAVQENNNPLPQQRTILPPYSPLLPPAAVHSEAQSLLCPILQSERQLVLTLCQRGDVELLRDLLESTSTQRFTDDLEIMVAAVSQDPTFLTLASPRLQAAPQLLLVGITPTSASSTLRTIGHDVMRKQPEIPTRAIQVCLRQHLHDISALIPPDVWATCRPLCIAWLQRGGEVLEAFRHQLDVQPPYTPNDIELPLAVARYNWPEMRKVGLALLSDRTFVLQALDLDHRILRFVSPELRLELQTLGSITRGNALITIQTLGHTVMREQPEIPTRAVKMCLKQYLHDLPALIPDDVWAHCRPLCLAWVQRGGHVLEAFQHQLEVQPPYTPEDIELPLAIARYNWPELRRVGRALLRDRSFILQALDMDSRTFRFAGPTLCQEFDIQVVAVGNYNKTFPVGTHSSIEKDLGRYMSIDGLARHIDERLQLHRTFCRDFLGGIASTTTSRRPHSCCPSVEPRCHLSMLDCGMETSQAFTKLIAEYLDVPLGPNLSLLRRARANLPHHATDSRGSA